MNQPKMWGHKTARFASIAGLCVAFGTACAPALAQSPDPLRQYEVPVGIDSGPLALPGLPGQGAEVLYTATVSAPGAAWTRVAFGEVELAPGAVVRVTSLEDNHDQELDATELAQWQNTTAYFNGDTLLVEVVGVRGEGVSRLRIDRVIAGDGFTQGAAGDSICGSTDDRELSMDPRQGRLMPVGCTAWMIDDCARCFLTAGHCTFSADVVQFNVPLSTAGGSVRMPPPEDQYAIDRASMQSNGGLGIGNDWAYFGTFPNSETGLTAGEAQGDWYRLADTAPSFTGDIRITGYGSTFGTGAPLQWNQVQKTHTGPFVARSGFGISYQTDTTGGNSGSPVIDETTGLAIGIHTHAGCSPSSGNNGTAIDRPELQDALENPTGVCCPPLTGIEIDAPDLDLVPPGQPFDFEVVITEVDGTLDPGSAELVYDAGRGFESVPLVALGGDRFRATLPALDCGLTTQYYVRASSDGRETTAPLGAPGTTFDALAATGVVASADYDFETADGWTVESTDIAAGAWERGVPGDFRRGDPAADFDGSGSAYVTGLGEDEDLDGGPTVLLSPVIDASDAPDNATLSYARWFSNDDGDDFLTIEISEDGGASFTEIERVADAGSGWTRFEAPLTDLVSRTDAVQLRFTTADSPNDSVTEAAIDAVHIAGFLCGSCPADLDGDGELSVFDFLAFQNLFLAGDLAADFDGDGDLTLFDFIAFQDAFDAGCP